MKSPGGHGGQPGGEGATSAAPTLRIVFRDPGSAEPGHPQSSIYSPISRPPSSIPSAQHFCRTGGLFRQRPGSSCRLPSSGVLSCTALLSGPVSFQTSSLEKLYGGSAPSLTALTPLHRKKSGGRGPGSTPVGGSPFGPLTRAIWAHVRMPSLPEGLLPTRDWAQAGPTLQLSPSTGQDATQSIINY